MNIMIHLVGIGIVICAVSLIIAVLWAQSLSDEDRESIGHGPKGQGR